MSKIATVKPSREDLARCVARFDDLVRCDTGLPDMALPECRRTFLNVLGFSQPKGEGVFSPFGDSAPAAISHLRAGFGLSFIAAEPGKGVLMHSHDTVETFMVMKGKWHYFEHDWVAEEGSFVFEPPGEIHTLNVPEDCEEMITFFNISGCMVYLDKDNRQIGYEDVFTKIDMCRAHYDKVGLGADYVDQFIR